MMKTFLLLFLLPVLAWCEEPVFFLSWTRDPVHTMTVVWLTSPETAHDVVEIRSKGQEEWRPRVGTHHSFTLSDKPLIIHTVEVTQLDGDQLYEFRMNKGAAYSFKTAPEELDHPVNFVVGGDAYHDDTETLAKMLRMVAKQDPLFTAVGGDIAYAFSSTLCKREKGERWLAFLRTWQKEMVTSEGRVIPMLPVLGNHDVAGGFGQTPAEATFFYNVFPLPNGSSYRTLDFGNYLSLFLLDSGHTNSMSGKQSDWLKGALKERETTPYTFAIYHIASLPSFRPLCDKRSQEVRTVWAPLFEEAKLTAAFEHHDHTLKRSHPIKKMKIDDEGIVYLGDGSMGLRKARVPHHPKPWFIASAQAAQAVWKTTLTKEGAAFEALDPNSCSLDTYKVSRKKPIPAPASKKIIADPRQVRKKSPQVIEAPSNPKEKTL
jgi:hypothetical protein